MVEKHQNSIGGTVEVPAGGTATLEHVFSQRRTVSLFEASKVTNNTANDAVTLDATFIGEADGNTVGLQTKPDDGPDSVNAENTVPYGAPLRIPSLIGVNDNDRVKVTFSNTGASAEQVEFDISTVASTVVNIGEL